MIAYILPPLGLTFIAWLTRRFFKGSEGSGIPQAIAALSMSSHVMRSKVLSLKVAAAKIFLTCLGLVSGRWTYQPSGQFAGFGAAGAAFPRRSV